jgi:hypothetical protein
LAGYSGVAHIALWLQMRPMATWTLKPHLSRHTHDTVVACGRGVAVWHWPHADSNILKEPRTKLIAGY